MGKRFLLSALILVATVAQAAAPKQHVLLFGKWLPVKLFVGPNDDKAVDMKIRSLNVDGKLKEFTTGEPHDITDRTFVIRRVFRLNDWLPQDEGTPHKWKWQRGGWIMVSRDTGRITQLNLPNFDPYYSLASWYRDYVAYCGLSDDGEKLYAVVAQIGQKKPILRRDLGPAHGNEMPDSECPAPDWQRQPSRVTFQPAGGQKLTYSVRGHAADLAIDSPASAEEEKP
jgi:hypothetical protein